MSSSSTSSEAVESPHRPVVNKTTCTFCEGAMGESDRLVTGRFSMCEKCFGAGVAMARGNSSDPRMHACEDCSRKCVDCPKTLNDVPLIALGSSEHSPGLCSDCLMRISNARVKRALDEHLESDDLGYIRSIFDEHAELLLDWTNGLGESLLHLCAHAGELELVRFLHERGADLAGRDKNDKTPLHSAAVAGGPNVVRYILENGVSPNVVDNENRTAAFSAIAADDLESLQLLLDAGVDVFIRDNFYGYSSLGHAAWWGRERLCEHLARPGSDFDSAIRAAKSKNNQPMVETLTRLKDELAIVFTPEESVAAREASANPDSMRLHSQLQEQGQLYFDIVRVSTGDQFNAVVSQGRLGRTLVKMGSSSADRLADMFTGQMGADTTDRKSLSARLQTLAPKEHLTGRIHVSGVMDELERWRQ